MDYDYRDEARYRLEDIMKGPIGMVPQIIDCGELIEVDGTYVPA